MSRFVYFVATSLSFSLGFFLYLAIETVYKRYFSSSDTHWTMGLLAGLAFVFLLYLDRSALGFFQKALLGAVFITLGELAFGIYLNLYRRLAIWDYSRLPFHFLGQICPLFSLIWLLLCCFVIPINRFLLLEVEFLTNS